MQNKSSDNLISFLIIVMFVLLVLSVGGVAKSTFNFEFENKDIETIVSLFLGVVVIVFVLMVFLVILNVAARVSIYFNQSNKITGYEGYKWIKSGRFKDDETKTWEERYRALEKHHIEETTFLIEEIRRLAEKKN